MSKMSDLAIWLSRQIFVKTPWGKRWKFTKSSNDDIWRSAMTAFKVTEENKDWFIQQMNVVRNNPELYVPMCEMMMLSELLLMIPDIEDDLHIPEE